MGPERVTEQLLLFLPRLQNKHCLVPGTSVKSYVIATRNTIDDWLLIASLLPTPNLRQGNKAGGPPDNEQILWLCMSNRSDVTQNTAVIINTCNEGW